MTAAMHADIDELGIEPPSSLSTRSNDTLITGKVKATLIDARDLQATAFSVVTERGTVFLMGRVTQRESDKATALVRGISGVQRVVRAFEIISEEELARIQAASGTQPAQQGASAPAAR